jgi:uncharacterized tellurite resistance protein B-like protein
MFNFFKKSDSDLDDEKFVFDPDLIGCALAYEVAVSDGEIDDTELLKIKSEILKKSEQLNLNPDEVFKTIEHHNRESISFNDFINQINDNFLHEQKIQMIEFLWQTAYADNVLNVDEERLIRRIADMVRIKDMKVLKLKDQAKNI